MHSREPATPPDGRRTALPWLGAPAIAAVVLLICAPFLLVDVPPLVDLPGHIGAAAIEAAGPNSPLHHYFGWRWMFTLNLGGQVLMKLLQLRLSLLEAGWWSTVLATALFATGCLAVVRVLNPRGGYGFAWALLFVFSFPLLTGFLNYVLAAGMALLAFAAAVALERRPFERALLLLAAQPVVLLSHAVGGAFLPLLVFAHAVGEVIDDRVRSPRAVAARMVERCWPLLATLATVASWKLVAVSGSGGMSWNLNQKLWSWIFILRDQQVHLDLGTTLASLGVLIAGYAWRARWTARQSVPAVAVALLFVISPASINGSALLDVRLLPVAMMLLLGLQDWSGAPQRVAVAVALSGAALLGARLTVTAASFADYAKDYRVQLSALDHVTPGSRVLAFVEQSCLRESWRNDRRDHLASLASLYRGAWVNDNWAVPGLHMLVNRYVPARDFSVDPSAFVWSRACSGGVLRGIDQALRYAPVQRVDYVWLIDTGLPGVQDTRLAPVWRAGRSVLYAVRPLGFTARQPRQE